MKTGKYVELTNEELQSTIGGGGGDLMCQWFMGIRCKGGNSKR